MTPTDWESLLAARLEQPVRVRYGRSRTQPVHAAYQPDGVRVRLHAFFGGAPPDVADALAQWLKVGRRARRACQRLDGWIDAQLETLPAAQPRPIPLDPHGRHHDLAALEAPLLACEFQLDFIAARPPPGVTWGRRGRSQARCSLMLGSYTPEQHVVRLHPVLDQRSVPEWFVRFVLFHEILHAALPDDGHGPNFTAREREYPEYDRAVAWQHKHLSRLIRAARRGTSHDGPRQRWLF